ncbi:MAG: hypothetical protein ABEJ91_04385 [Candidatus Nanohaloarchaea archaeon]
MSWYAADELDNAWEEAKDVLLPFDVGTWARLLLIVVLTGHGVSMPNMPSSLPSDTGSSGSSFQSTYATASEDPVTQVASAAPDFSMTGLSTASPAASSVLGIAIMLVIFLGLGLFYVSSVFEFIYYQSLLDKDVSIRENFRKHARRGARYFAFRLGVLLAVLLLIAGSVAALVANPLAGGLMLVATVAVLLPVMVLLGLTNNFVLLGMMENQTGIIRAWKEFYPTLREEWKEVGVYLLIRFALRIGIGVFGLIWALVSFLVLLIPFGIVGVLLYMIAPLLVAIPVVLGILAWLLLVIGAQVVFQTYLYYYAILVYHDLTAG